MAGIPSRAAEIKRDLSAMIQALRGVGGGGSANELRSDAGIFFHYGVEETLSRDPELFTQETVVVVRAFTAANTSNIIFSFPQDHYLLNLCAFGTVTPANLEWIALNSRDQTSSIAQLLLFAEIGDVQVLVGGTVDVGGNAALAIVTPSFQTTFPRFTQANTDYELEVRGAAGGPGTMLLALTVVRAPKGVPIPH